MKDHIIIPLLVVCVGLPLVTLGMYYLCESLPIVEAARGREKDNLAALKQRAEKERDDDGVMASGRQTARSADDETEDRARETERVVVKKNEKVAINGISINLPYQQLKQELAAKFGGIEYEYTSPNRASFGSGGSTFKLLDDDIIPRDDYKRQAEEIVKIFRDFDPSLFGVIKNNIPIWAPGQKYLKQIGTESVWCL